MEVGDRYNEIPNVIVLENVSVARAREIIRAVLRARLIVMPSGN